MEPRVIPVSEFVEVVNATLKETWPSDIAVEGEVSGFRVSQGQWVSFDLKDDKALVNVFMTVWNLRVPVEDGMRVRVYGSPRVYPKYGKFSLSAEKVEIAGEGSLRRALMLLRERLSKEGLFDPSRKRELMRFPKRIALIASRESAAYGDFLRILGERWGGLEIDSYHVVVQGERAPQSVMSALQAAQEGEYDAIVITRGGGSFEDLMAFNDEQLVRAIHASRFPTLVAIGHERDITLAEEVADIRGSTPTDCARRLVPDRQDVLFELSTILDRAEQSLMNRIDAGRQLLERAMFVPSVWLSSRRAQLQNLVDGLVSDTESWVRMLSERLENQCRVLVSLDPRRVLARGYAILLDSSGKPLSSVVSLGVGQEVRVQVSDGVVHSKITEIAPVISQSQLL